MQHIKHIWPKVKDLSDDLGVPYTTAHSWVIRGRIPADYDIDIIRAAKKRGAKLTLEDLAKARRVATGSVTHNASHVNAAAADQVQKSHKGAA